MVSEKEELQEFVDTTSTEIFELIEKEEKEPPEMVATEDPGPRFVEKKEVTKEDSTPGTAPPKAPSLTRHPRGLPKFSRIV